MKKTWISSAHQGFVTENMHSNTLSAFLLAARKGADLIETDVRTTSDGVMVANHDPIVVGYNEKGEEVSYEISTTDSKTILGVILAPNDPAGVQYVPTLDQILDLAYNTGMIVNIDLKEGSLHACDVARRVRDFGMRGRVIYATNGAGAQTILDILKIDPDARFIDKPKNFTAEALASVPDYPAKCFSYTANFSAENIAAIRASGCMLASISLDEKTAPEGLKWHPEMAEYLHTSDFEAIDRMMLEKWNA